MKPTFARSPSMARRGAGRASTFSAPAIAPPAEDAWDEDEENYDDEWPDPDFIEDGYRYWTLNFDCLFNSKVAVTTSNTYTFFIDGKAGPEYTRAELSKMKWRLTLVRT